MPPPQLQPAGHAAHAVEDEFAPVTTPYDPAAHDCPQPMAALVAFGTEPYVPMAQGVHCETTVQLLASDQLPSGHAICTEGVLQ